MGVNSKVKLKIQANGYGNKMDLYFNLQEKNLDWFPRMRAMSLTADDGEGEQNELRNLQQQLEATNKLVQTLSTQLAELKDQVSTSLSVCSICIVNLAVNNSCKFGFTFCFQMTEQRKQKQRIGLLNTPSIPLLPGGQTL